VEDEGDHIGIGICSNISVATEMDKGALDSPAFLGASSGVVSDIVFP
jgi:hypothetical protein